MFQSAPTSQFHRSSTMVFDGIYMIYHRKTISKTLQAIHVQPAQPGHPLSKAQVGTLASASLASWDFLPSPQEESGVDEASWMRVGDPLVMSNSYGYFMLFL